MQVMTLTQLHDAAARARTLLRQADALGDANGRVTFSELTALSLRAPDLEPGLYLRMLVASDPTLAELETTLEDTVRLLTMRANGDLIERAEWSDSNGSSGVDSFSAFEEALWTFWQAVTEAWTPLVDSAPHLTGITNLEQGIEVAVEQGPRTVRGHLQLDAAEARLLARMLEANSYAPADVARILQLVNRLTHVDRPATANALAGPYEAEDALAMAVRNAPNPSSGPGESQNAARMPEGLSEAGQALWGALEAVIAQGATTLKGNHQITADEARAFVAVAEENGVDASEAQVLVEAADRMTHVDHSASDYDVYAGFAAEDAVTDALCAHADKLPADVGLTGRTCAPRQSGGTATGGTQPF
jgi:hypothetical protein